MSKLNNRNQEDRNKKNRGEEAGGASQTPPNPDQSGSSPLASANSAKSAKSGKSAKLSKSAHSDKAQTKGKNASGAKRATSQKHVPAGKSETVTPGEEGKVMRSARIRRAVDAERLVRVTVGARQNMGRRHRGSELIMNQKRDDRRNPLSPQTRFEQSEATGGDFANGQSEDHAQAAARDEAATMVMPLFPLKNIVLFTGMVLPLNIFEPRYREMINTCIEGEGVFGIVLIDEGDEVGGESTPHRVGTAARITKVTRQEDGRINIVAVGTQRFEILELDHSKSYLQATVRPLPIVNGATRIAGELVHKMMPRIFEYVELLEEATKQKLPINRLPEDPSTLAILVAIGIQAPPKDKQKLLEKRGVPEMLAYEAYLLSRESQFLRHMVETQHEVQKLNTGPTGYIFPN